MADRAQILFQTSHELKDAIGAFAQEKNMTSSEVIRLAVAIYIGYDIAAASLTQGPRKKYANKEARLEAQKNRAKEERNTLKTLLEDFARAQRRNDVATLEEWLAKRKEQGKLDDN